MMYGKDQLMVEIDFVLKPLLAQCQCNTALLWHRITDTLAHLQEYHKMQLQHVF